MHDSFFGLNERTRPVFKNKLDELFILIGEYLYRVIDYTRGLGGILVEQKFRALFNNRRQIWATDLGLFLLLQMLDQYFGPQRYINQLTNDLPASWMLDDSWRLVK